jgi:hypothetical protein
MSLRIVIASLIALATFVLGSGIADAAIKMKPIW